MVWRSRVTEMPWRRAAPNRLDGAEPRFRVHRHARVLDGVFAEDGPGALRFHPAPPPTDDDMDDVLAAIRLRVAGVTTRDGH